MSSGAMTHVNGQIIEHIRACSQTLFSHYLASPPTLSEGSSLQDIAALPGRTGVIGFTGQFIRGTLVLVANDALLAAMWPGHGAAPHDWIGELANQALGSMKRALLSHGVDFDLGLPSVTTSSNCRIFIRSESTLFTLFSPYGLAMLCFQYTLSDGFVWQDSPRPISSTGLPSLDSDVILF